MKSLIIGLMLIAVVSCAVKPGKPGRKRDVSEVYQAQGWSKGADGYSYDIPKIGLPDLKIAADPEPVEEEKQCPNGGSGSFCCINGKENEYCCENDVTDNQYCCENGADNKYCCTNGADNEGCILASAAPAAEDEPAVEKDYLPPKEEELREYLPPAEARRRLRFRRRYRLVRRQ